MTKRFLDNGLNTKDETRLVNAGSKLTASQQAIGFSFDDNVQPVMIAGVEENVNLSTVDLIGCIRDQNGNNRLAVNNRGVASLSKEQVCLNGVNYSLTADTAVALFSTAESVIPKGKAVYITSLAITNGSTASKPHQFIFNLVSPSQQTSGDILNIIVPASSTLYINNLMIPIYTNDTITCQDLKLTDAGTNLDSVSIFGFIQ